MLGWSKWEYTETFINFTKACSLPGACNSVLTFSEISSYNGAILGTKPHDFVNLRKIILSTLQAYSGCFDLSKWESLNTEEIHDSLSNCTSWPHLEESWEYLFHLRKVGNVNILGLFTGEMPEHPWVCLLGLVQHAGKPITCALHIPSSYLVGHGQVHFPRVLPWQHIFQVKLQLRLWWKDHWRSQTLTYTRR